LATRVFAAGPVPVDNEPPRNRPSATGRSAIDDGWARLAADEAVRVTVRRRLTAHGGATEGVTVWCRPRRLRSVRSLAVIVEVASRTIAGRRNWSHVVALQVELQRRCDDKRTWARMCRSIARDPRISDAAIATSRAMASCADWSPVIARLHAITWTRAGASQPGVQASLFDRRAVRAAEAREAVLAKLAAHAARQSRWLIGPSDDERLEAHVVALLPCEDARAR
jgi:hypothetical protein